MRQKKWPQEQVLHEPEEQDGQLPAGGEVSLLMLLIPKLETHFCILFDPHEGQFIFASLFTGMISSNPCWHFLHLNSYIGILSFLYPVNYNRK
jgi:hypothetical protein